MGLWERLFGPPVPRQQVEEVATALREGHVVVVDVRDARAFRQGHIPGARHASPRDVLQAVRDLAPDTPIVVVCRSGNQSVGAARRLLRAGFTRVSSMDGGMRAWVQAGLPVERD